MKNNLENIDKDYGGRLVELINFLKIKPSRLKQRIGYSTSFFSLVKNGHSPMPVEMAKKICDLYPQISFEWLFLGKGEMLLDIKDIKLDITQHQDIDELKNLLTDLTARLLRNELRLEKTEEKIQILENRLKQ